MPEPSSTNEAALVTARPSGNVRTSWRDHTLWCGPRSVIAGSPWTTAARHWAHPNHSERKMRGNMQVFIEMGLFKCGFGIWSYNSLSKLWIAIGASHPLKHKVKIVH